MNIGEVVPQIQAGIPWMAIGGVVLWLLQRFVLPRLSPQSAGTPALDWLKQIRGYVAKALALFKWVPGGEPDAMLQKLLDVLDALLSTPGVEHRSVGEVKAMVTERMKV